MKRLVVESWLLLLYLEFIMHFREFRELHRIVKEQPTRARANGHSVAIGDLCQAMDYACVFYFKRVLCLQRSSATTLLLRRHAMNAEMVIGIQLTPFKSHAWVELDGTVVNDRSSTPIAYLVLERC